MHGELPPLPLPQSCPAPTLAQLCPLLALLFRTQVSMKANIVSVRKNEMEKLRQRQGGEHRGVHTIPEADKVPYALAHIELETGLQTAPWGFSGCSSIPGICALVLAGCQPLGIPVGHNAIPPCHSVAGLWFQRHSRSPQRPTAAPREGVSSAAAMSVSCHLFSLLFCISSPA